MHRVIIIFGFGLLSVINFVTGQQDSDIIEYENVINPDGSYKWKYISGNGITAEEEGHLKNGGNEEMESEEVHGSYQYKAPGGMLITVNYVADENGFRPVIKFGDKASVNSKAASLILDDNAINSEDVTEGSSPKTDDETPTTSKNEGEEKETTNKV